MFSHIMIGGNDIAAAKSFYDAALGALGVEPGVIDPKDVVSTERRLAVRHQYTYRWQCGKSWQRQHGWFPGRQPRGRQRWHTAGLANGGSTAKSRLAHGDLYLAYRDPSGNKICALHRMS